MRASVVSALGLVAGATAFPSHFNFKRGNGTEPIGTKNVSDSPVLTTAPAEEGITTLTVSTTLVHTITSCAPAVTDCPANDSDIATLPAESLSEVVVTDTIILSTTVCPIAEATAIESSIISEAEEGHITGTTIIDVAIPTGKEITISHPFAPVQTADALPEGETGIITSKETLATKVPVTKVFTVTMGDGKSASVSVGTTVEESEVVTASIVASDAHPQVDVAEPTTTTTMTTQTTATMTIVHGTETSVNSPVNSDIGSGPSGHDNGANSGVDACNTDCQCEDAVTVTITEPAKTVFVTIVPDHTAAEAETTDAAVVKNADPTVIHTDANETSAAPAKETSAAPAKEAELPGKETELPGKETELPGKEAELPGKEAELPGKEAELPGKEAELPEEIIEEEECPADEEIIEDEEELEEEEDCPVDEEEAHEPSATEDVVLDVTATVVPTPLFPSNGTAPEVPLPTATGIHRRHSGHRHF